MRWATGLALAVALALAATPAHAEHIADFAVQVTVRADGSFGVEERIRWNFEDAQRHGIYREIPIAYERPGSADFHIRVHVDAVTDANGQPWPKKTVESGGYLRIRIGDPSSTVTGVQIYVIRYHVERGILYFPDHQELYWNATGTEWPVPIEHAVAHVALPASTVAAPVDVTCFTGAMGSRERACKIQSFDFGPNMPPERQRRKSAPCCFSRPAISGSLRSAQIMMPIRP